jgi:hypothetical protein
MPYNLKQREYYEKRKHYPETPISPLLATYFWSCGRHGGGCSCGSLWVLLGKGVFGTLEELKGL